MIKVAVSACLLGAPVRPDGSDKKVDHPVLRRWLAEGRIVSVCPEMLGGLGTPRPPAEIVDHDGSRRVVTRDGQNLTAAFQEGARVTADQINADQVRVAILKNGSPSCGSSYVYDGTFSRSRIPGEGLTAALLRGRGVTIFSEDEIDDAAEWVAQLEARAR